MTTCFKYSIISCPLRASRIFLVAATMTMMAQPDGVHPAVNLNITKQTNYLECYTVVLILQLYGVFSVIILTCCFEINDKVDHHVVSAWHGL